MSDVSRRKFLRTAATTVAGVVGVGLAAGVARASQLSNEEIIRAWKDEQFRNSLTPEQLAQLPPHPSGKVEVDSSQQLDDDLGPISGRTRGRGSRCGSRRSCGCRA